VPEEEEEDEAAAVEVRREGRGLLPELELREVICHEGARVSLALNG